MDPSFRLLYASKLNIGDLVAVAAGNDYVNVYEDSLPISFVNVIFKAYTNLDTFLILSRIDPMNEGDMLHPQYVKVLFSCGVIGIIRASTLQLLC